MTSGDDRLPVHVLTGFLGSGKTTLLNALLARSALRDSAVIVNEFGDIAVDHILVERSEDRLVELVGGCICCAVRGDLAATLDDLLRRRARGDCAPFEQIVIETTGLADPAPILNLLITDVGLAERTRAGVLIATVDAVNGHHTLDNYPQALKQVALADRIMVTKSDLGPLAAVQITERLRAINPDAEFCDPMDGPLASVPTHFFESSVARGLTVPEDHANHHRDGIETFTLVRETPVPGAALALLIEVLAEQLGSELLRIKGLVALAERPEAPAVIHGAQHVYHPIDFLPAWPDENRSTRIVFITAGPARDWVECLFDMLVWEVEDVSVRLHHE